MAERPPLPEHVTQPLLTRITADSLDGDYQHVADRRALAGARQVQRKPRRTAAAVAVVFGLLIVVAAVQTSRNAATSEETRQELIRQNNLARDELRDNQEQVGDLREENADLRAADEEQESLESDLERELLQVRGVSGFAPVGGEGVRIRLDDSPAGDSDGRIRDEDLSLLVDGLWSAGAEAIAINGQRLTSLTGIRSANRAILVNSRALKPPYTVLAIGDVNTLQALFAESSAGVEFLGLRSAFGFEFEMVNDDALTLPADRRPQLRSAAVYRRAPNKEVLP